MIQVVRVDDRLLHGQVAVSWKAALNYEAIVIASDAAANDKIRSSALKLAKPDGVLIAIRTIDDAISLLNNEKLKNLKVFVVTDSIENAEKLFGGIHETPTLNIGGIQKEDHKKPIVSYAYVTEEDIDALKRLEEQGTDIEFRLVPTEKPVRLSELV